MRRKIERKKGGRNSAFTPLGLPVHSGSHYLKLQNNIGYIQFIKPNKLQVSMDFPKWSQHIFVGDLRDNTMLPLGE